MKYKMVSDTFNEDYFDVMARYPDNHFDLACCDIPYGINVGKMAYLTEQNTQVLQKNGSKLKIKNRPKYALKEWDLNVPDQRYYDEVCRISKHQIIFGVEYVDWIGLGSGRIIWDKLVADGMSFNRYEKAYCSFIDFEMTVPLLWSGFMQAKSLKEPTYAKGNKKKNEKRIHPTQKPVMLYCLLYNIAKEYLLKNNIVLKKVFDSCLGSGSSRI